MPVAERHRLLAQHLAHAWLRAEGGEPLPAAVYPAYLDKLRVLIERLALWGEREDKVPSRDEFASILEDLRFLVAQADPYARSSIYLAARQSLHAAEEEADRALR